MREDGNPLTRIAVDMTGFHPRGDSRKATRLARVELAMPDACENPHRSVGARPRCVTIRQRTEAG
jgi:hypothetical protein